MYVARGCRSRENQRLGIGRVEGRPLRDGNTRLRAPVAAKERIAREEQGHASLSGDILAWCCAEGGRDVRWVVSATERSLA